MGFAHFRHEMLAIRSSAVAILVLAVGFLGAGLGPLLPRWATVIGTNMLLLSAGAIFYSGFSAFFWQRKAQFDRFGWAVVLLTALPFWYWGLVEPNGQYRSAIFSLAAAVINSRTAWLLWRAARQNTGSTPVRLLAALFGTLTLWMLVRSMRVLAETAPLVQPGANPTTWVTVFWYIVLVSLVTAAIIWMEIAHLEVNERNPGRGGEKNGSMVNTVGILRGKLSLLWAFVAILIFAVLAELIVTYGALLQAEREKLTQNAQLANDAFVEHTLQVVTQVDTLLKAMRGYYLRTGSAEEAEHYMAGLGFNRALISDIYLIDAKGRILTPWKDLALGRNVAERDYFAFHRDNPEDQIFIDSVQTGRVTGKEQFRLTRRISHPDGSFAGAVVAPIEPGAFTKYYRQLVVNRDDLASLLGTQDHKIRARFPPPDAASWNVPIESPVWEALARKPQGSYRSTSFVDKIERQMIYKRVGDLPLVMVTGYSETAVRANALGRTWRIALGALIFILVVVALATILTLVLRQREEQAILLIRLKESNDRSTALFNATHDAVILLDGGLSIDCNPQALKMFGATSKEDSLGLPPWSPLFTPPLQSDGTESAAYAQRMSEQALQHGTYRFEFLYKKIDTGDEFQVDIMLTAIELNGKTILQAVLRDITERNRFEREIQSANVQLARHNEEQDRFLSMLSHEIKTPLAVIRMSLGTGAEAIDVASRSRLVRAVADINAIVERCLQTDRLEHGRIEVEQSACNPGDVLRQVVSACSEPARVRFDAGLLPDCVTDKQLLSVILTNLIDNAIKYGVTDTAIDITAEPVARVEQAGLTIVIANLPGTAGMPDPQQVFHRYYRAPGAHSKTGSGLGLHVAEGLARMLGGKLSYRPEAGTVKFALWIPL